MQNYFLRYLIVFLFFACHASVALVPPLLTLQDAILLAVRTNPNVQQSQLNHVLQKYNVFIQRWEFDPHYTLQASATLGQSRVAANPFVTQRGFNIEPGMTYRSPYGTKIALSASNQETKHYNPGLSLEIVQPLMRGFGKPIVEAALNNARDSEFISHLNVESVLRSTVTDVINAYLNVLLSERQMQLDEEALKRAELSVAQTKAFIKAGHKAGNEIVTVSADVANTKTLIEGDKNNLRQARYALLTAIGVDPNTNIEFASLNIDALIKKYHLPTLAAAQNQILQNDIQYQTDQITLHGQTTRSLLEAEDKNRWRLDLEAKANTGGGVGGGQNAGFNSLFNGANRGQSVALSLEIPIDDQIGKQAVLSAKIALKEAELALKQERWRKQTDAINGWNDVISADHTLRYAIDAEKLQQQTYTISYQKYLHGLIDGLELQTAQTQLIQTQQTLLNARISYLKALVNLDLLTGNTLKTWYIQVRSA